MLIDEKEFDLTKEVEDQINNTMYSLMAEVFRSGKKIITVETRE
jgi:hypothetical protein